MLYERRIENSLTKSTRELERRQIIRQYQQQQAEQEQSIPIPINNNRDEAATRIDVGEENGELKKQSQSVSGQNGATSYMKGDYDNNAPAGDDGNKANLSLREQSQLQREIQHVKRLRGQIATAISVSQ
jgi:hypothetical protein